MIKDNRSEIRKVLIITLLLNLFVMGLKAALGWATGSLSLQADALHSFTDSANNVLGLFTSRFSSPYPDREHPYGHQKFEALGALGIAGFLAIACFEIIQSVIEKLFLHKSQIEIRPLELSLLIIVLVINLFVTVYERKVGLRLNSPILIADAKHTMSDVWVTILVLLGLIGIWQGNLWHLPQLQWLDVIFAFPVALLVFRSGWEVLTDNLPWLVDEMAIAPEAIYEIVMEVPGVINCHEIASRGVIGRQVFIEMHAIVDANDVETAHQITEAIEAKLIERFAPVRVIVHVEPPRYKSDLLSYNY